MDITNSDLALLAFLESIESSSEVSDGCDIDAIVSQGLATCEGALHAHAGRPGSTWILRTVLQGDHRPNG